MFRINILTITFQSCSQFEVDFFFKEFALYFFYYNRLNNNIDLLLVLLYYNL
jgi:hypothetical protein